MHKASAVKKNPAKKNALRANSKRKMSKKLAKVQKKRAVLTTTKRFGGSAVDAQGRALPVDYDHHHIHDPYDFFYADTSKIFDEHPILEAFARDYPTLESRVHLKDEADNMLMEQLPEVRAKITDMRELEAFDNTLAFTLLQPETEPLSKEEIIYNLERDGITHPKHLDPFENSWKEFFTNDFKHGSAPEKMRTIAYHAVMWSSALYLAKLGVDAYNQYLYDLQYPLHGDHDH